MTPRDIEKLAESRLLSDVEEVVLSGGEPTLRDDFPEIVLAFHKNLKKAEFNITLNGNHPDRAYNLFKKIKEQAPDFMWASVNVSLNGPEEIHDASRGVAGSFKNAVRTAELLKEFARKVDFSFTFLKNNVEYFKWVQDFAKTKGMNAHICWTVMNDRFNTVEEDLVFRNNPKLVSVLEDFAGIKNIAWGSDIALDFFKYRYNLKWAYLYDSILNERIIPCRACKTLFHLDPYGNVYPCNFNLSDDRILGNIKEEKFDDLWKRIPKKILYEIATGACMYPNGVCGDSDLNRSVLQADTPVFKWFTEKRKHNKKLIEIEKAP